MQQKRYLTINPILIRSTQQPSFVNFSNFSLQVKKIPSNSGNAPAISNRDFTNPSTKIWSCSIHSPYSQVNYLRITAKKSIASTSSIFGRWHFKHWMEKVDTFLTWLMIIVKISNHLTSKRAHGSNYLVTQTHYALMLQELLQTMPQ